MSTTTTNYSLHKIDLADAPPDITVLNDNWDIIDSELNALKHKQTECTGTGSAYVVTVTGIDSLTAGVSFMFTPNVVSSEASPTINVNGFGAKNIRRRISGSTSTTVATGGAGGATNWLSANKPVILTYDGNYWIADLLKPNMADVYGTLSIASGGTGRSTLTNGYFLRGNGTSAVTMSSAASARDAMGLGNTTGALPIANGGTGATTANGAANNLCEVGTWTPRLTNVEGSAPTYTTDWNIGSYLKIGTLVWVLCDMALGISNIGGNYAGVSGLPYANDGYCGLHLVEAYNVLDLGGNGNIYPNTSVIGNMVRFKTPTGANSYNWGTNTSLGTNVGRLRFSGIYRTT